MQRSRRLWLDRVTPRQPATRRKQNRLMRAGPRETEREREKKHVLLSLLTYSNKSNKTTMLENIFFFSFF